MASVLKLCSDLYKWWFYELADPRSESLFLMSNPFYTLLIIGIYLKFVLSWGPKFMENRKPFNIDKILITYNTFQILCCASLLYRALKHTYVFGKYSYICEPVDMSNSEHAITVLNGVHEYFLLKLLDLLDTVFIVLRKKWKQVTFLHLYHHGGMAALAWVSVKFVAGGQTVFVGLLNCTVHIIMYSYYLLSLFKRQRLLWWKKYLTQLQIIQFFLIELNFLGVILFPCGYPRFVGCFILVENSFMLILFLDFYYKAYIRKPAVKSQ